MENETLTLENEMTADASTPDGGMADERADEAQTAVAQTDTEPYAEGEEAPEGEDIGATDFAALAAEDLSVLRATFPELSDMGTLAELPEPTRYGELREAGLSPIEAFCASHHEILLSRRSDNRTHLSPSIGRATGAVGGRISAKDLAEARDLFPSLSDREIEVLYHRVNNKR